MKTTILSFLFLSVSLINVCAQDMQTRINRVDTQGEVLNTSSELYYTLYDKMVNSLKNMNWNDEITQIKTIKIVPADDPVNWYYYISFSTKKTTSPFYVGYDPYNTYMGTYFIFDSYPQEILDFAESEKLKTQIALKNYEDALVVAKEIFPILTENLYNYFEDSIMLKLNNLYTEGLNISKELVNKYKSRDPELEYSEEQFKKDFDSNVIKYYNQMVSLKGFFKGRLETLASTINNYGIELGKQRFFNLVKDQYEKQFSKQKGNIINNANIYNSNFLKFAKKTWVDRIDPIVISNLEQLQINLNENPDYLKSKLDVANDEQKFFWGIYLNPDQGNLVARYNNSCQSNGQWLPLNDMYEHIWDYMNSLKYWINI